MTSTSTQTATSRRIGIYNPIQQISMWGDEFGPNLNPNTIHNRMIHEDDTNLANKIGYNSQESLGPSADETKSISDKLRLQRRLAQNREAARKSRLRKKAYVQQLESGRTKLAQLEQELEKARQLQSFCKQGVYGGLLNTSNGLLSANSAGIATFEIEYDLWVCEHRKRDDDLSKALLTHTSEIELGIYVDSCLSHYYELFRMKANAAKSDVFYFMNGLWRTPVEQLFNWIGGFRPSDLLYILMPQMELMDTQVVKVRSLRQSCEQAEEALTQGMDKLKQTLAQTIAMGPTMQINCAMETLEALQIFLNQADHLRQQTLQEMFHILTFQQAAKGLLALSEYFQRLRVLSSLWSTRPRDPTILLP